ncbi:uncharacterized protein LOC141618259 [Silene latifolia]|uniref:uncharacterized protein LOC141618259 n=1 Tax=Silene latifolia TaxID=37657 RepID=UPI003D780DBC
MSSKVESDNGDNTNTNTSELCEECKTVKFKYKCPACSRRTCSLTCVKSHKKSSGCTGKRDATVFVPLSQFDDSTLVSDYNLLEDIKRVAESSQRMRTQLCAYYQHRLPRHLQALQNAATRRRTRIRFYPPGMSKRQKNQTRFISKPKSIKWTIEWRFHSTDISLLEHMVNENSTLRSVVGKHLQPSPWRNKLRRFAEETVDNLKCYIRINQQYANSSYRELDLDTPLRELFSGLVILEYPIIHIFLPADPCNFKVVQDVKRTLTEVKSKEPITEDTSSPLVICSKEEEIVEDESPEPKIFDFLDKSIKELSKNSPTKEHVTEAKIVEDEFPEPKIFDFLDKSIKELPKDSPTKEHVPEAKDVQRSTEVEMLDSSIDDFDFDQELIDAYSLLMEQGNPDNFIDYNREIDAGERLNADVFFADLEELEEGEIPSSD